MTDRRPTLGRCKNSGKVRYATRTAALDALRGWNARHRTEPQLVRVYQCPSCRRWHTTRQEQP